MVLKAVPAKDALSFGPFRLDAGERLLTRDGAPVELGARALDILIALVSAPKEVISKKDLLSRVWPEVTDSDIDRFGDGTNVVDLDATCIRPYVRFSEIGRSRGRCLRLANQVTVAVDATLWVPNAW